MRRGATLTAIVAVVLGTVGVGAPAVAQVVGDSFQIAYGDTVADGVPDVGAGNIEIGGAEDSYSFDVAAGDVAIFDTLSGSTTTFRWRLEAPDGSVLFDAAYVDRAVELAGTGVHTLTVYGTSAAAVGIYSFRLLLTPPAEMFDVAYGDAVSDGVPAVGAGNIEVPGAVDAYWFDGSAGQTVVFDTLAGPTSGLRWILLSPSGAEVFNNIYTDREADLPEDGTYRLTVQGLSVAGTGDYSFRLLQVPALQEFAIAVGDTVSDGVPAAGAGNIEVPGAVDAYLFDGSAGQTVVFDTLAGPASGLRWILSSPSGTDVFDVIYSDRQTTLPETGTYTLTVSGLTTAGVGVYSFQIVEVPPQVDEFSIEVGEMVSDGAPGPGAGNIEGPGAVDVYSFEGLAGQNIVLDTLAGPTSGLRWVLSSPGGTEVFDVIFSDQLSVLPESGTYALRVSGLTVAGSGTYSFQLLEAPINRDPVAEDDLAETDAGSTVDIEVLANDSDPDGDPLVVDAVTQPAHGAASTDGVDVTYVPDAGFFGTDTFTYTVADGQGGFDTATATVTVNEPPNNPPTVEDIADQQNFVGDDVVLEIEADDPDGDGLVYEVTGLPPGLVVDSQTGEIAGTIQPGSEVGSPYSVEVSVTDTDGAVAPIDFRWAVQLPDDGVVDVRIDLPLSCVFVNGFGVIPVVVYGGDQFDVRAIDLTTVGLEGMPVQRVFAWHAAVFHDYDDDGFEDVLVLIDEARGVLAPGVSTVTLIGSLENGTSFEGVDDICIHRHSRRGAR